MNSFQALSSLLSKINCRENQIKTPWNDYGLVEPSVKVKAPTRFQTTKSVVFENFRNNLILPQNQNLILYSALNFKNWAPSFTKLNWSAASKQFWKIICSNDISQRNFFRRHRLTASSTLPRNKKEQSVLCGT